MTKSYDVWWQKAKNQMMIWRVTIKKLWERTIEMLDTSDIKGKTILDVGCNQGGFKKII